MHSTLQEKRKSAYRWGKIAEKITYFLLTLKGYRILAHNYKTPVGEIDLIARKGNMIVYIEVKARDTKTEALDALAPQQRRRIEHAALVHQQRENINAENYRFDLVLCTKDALPSHIKQAWREGE